MIMARKVTTTHKAVVTALAWGVGLLIFFPILWTILTSFKSEGDAIRGPFEMLASAWTLESYGEVQHRSNYARHFWNSVVISWSPLFSTEINAPSTRRWSQTGTATAP